MKKIIIIFVAVFILILVILVYRGSVSAKKNILEINGVKFNVDIARTPEEQKQGLSGRESLKNNEGMLFIFSRADFYGFWMKEMKFPLDMVWVSGEKIAGFTENVDSQIGAKESELKIYYPPEKVDKVLEIKEAQ